MKPEYSDESADAAGVLQATGWILFDRRSPSAFADSGLRLEIFMSMVETRNMAHEP